jgi:hypothetical protein
MIDGRAGPTDARTSESHMECSVPQMSVDAEATIAAKVVKA